MAKNVLFIFSTLAKTGPVNIIYNIILSLDREKFKPIVLTLSPESANKPSSYKDYENLNVDVHSLNLSRLEGVLSARKIILKFCKDKGVDTIHLIGFRPDMLVKGSTFKEFNIVSSIFSNVFDDYTLLYGRIKGRVMAFLHMKSLRGKTAVACSRFVKDELTKWCNAKSFLVIRNSVSMERFKIPSLDEKFKARKKLGIPSNDTVYIFVGVLIERKDPITTIKGFLSSEIYKTGKSKLLILGDGPLREECELVAKSDDVMFLGNTSETLSYLQCADFYIASSLSEGLPTSVIEAIGCGIPPILSDIKPHQEILQFLPGIKSDYKIADFKSLSKLIDSFHVTKSADLNNSWRKIAEVEFNSKIMSQNYQSLY